MSTDPAPYGSPEWEEAMATIREKWTASDREVAEKVRALVRRAETVAVLDTDDLTAPAALRDAVVDIAAVLVGTLALIRDETDADAGVVR
ncbi:MAG: hypothetical protein L0I24_06845 [Pseudonocardia sp.]|nr:hypothetical protein [Pseudonocardia sp.]